MAIPTSRTKEAAVAAIDKDKCNGCGLCVDVCKDFGFVVIDNKASISKHPLFGCVGCGHCMAICPKSAIRIEGRAISNDDLIPLPDMDETFTYESLFRFLQRRRSIREFGEKTVEPALIDKIIAAVTTAPMGIPPSDVHVLVLNTKEKVYQFVADFCAFLEGSKWFVSKWFLTLMRPFWGKINDKMFRRFIRPLIYCFIDEMKKGNNLLTYEAPVAMYFYGTPFSDPADPVVAATYAMIAAESLGLSTCMIGSIHPLIQYGRAARKLREKYGIRYKSRAGLFVIMGYSRITYQKGIRRTLATVDFKK